MNFFSCVSITLWLNHSWEPIGIVKARIGSHDIWFLPVKSIAFLRKITNTRKSSSSRKHHLSKKNNQHEEKQNNHILSTLAWIEKLLNLVKEIMLLIHVIERNCQISHHIIPSTWCYHKIIEEGFTLDHCIFFSFFFFITHSRSPNFLPRQGKTNTLSQTVSLSTHNGTCHDFNIIKISDDDFLCSLTIGSSKFFYFSKFHESNARMKTYALQTDNPGECHRKD